METYRQLDERGRAIVAPDGSSFAADPANRDYRRLQAALAAGKAELLPWLPPEAEAAPSAAERLDAIEAAIADPDNTTIAALRADIAARLGGSGRFGS